MIREPANTPDFVVEHLRRYLHSAGSDGHLWDSTGFGDHGLIPTLLLTSLGRHSAEPVRTPLIYAEHAGNYIVVASNGGSANHPAWYLNLSAQVSVELQVAAKSFPATASTAAATERDALWSLMCGIYPTYADLQKKTSRIIPVVVLTPAPRPASGEKL